MTDLRTAALRALEALESLFTLQMDYDRPKQCGEAITALRAALARPEDKSQAAFEHWVETVEATQGCAISRNAVADAAPIIQPEIKDDKPFGYFRAEPFGWTDCAPTDEGAIPLYTKVDSQGIAKQIPPEAQTEAEKIAYCAGWWAAMEAKRQWQSLTEEEVFHVENNVPDSVISDRQWTVYFAHALDAALRRKNHG
jgi:hypothetical protein